MCRLPGKTLQSQLVTTEEVSGFLIKEAHTYAALPVRMRPHRLRIRDYVGMNSGFRTLYSEYLSGFVSHKCVETMIALVNHATGYPCTGTANGLRNRIIRAFVNQNG